METLENQSQPQPSIGKPLAVLIALISFFSYGTFNFEILSLDIQQAATLALWLLAGGISLYVMAGKGQGFIKNFLPVPLAFFFGFCLLSTGWTDMETATIMKAVNLAAIVLMVAALSAVVTPRQFIHYTMYGLTAVLVCSVILVFVKPEIGVMHTWEHEGKWSGLFNQKQLLGFTSATMIYYAAMSYIKYRRFWYLAVMPLALLCVWGSQSRSALFLAILSILLAVGSTRFKSVRKTLQYMPLMMVTAAGILIPMWAYTGDTTIRLFGFETDLNSRTFIWSFALRTWTENILFGTGYNGFWSNTEQLNTFLGDYGWILENYHDGYVATFVEIGFVGFLLFWLLTMNVSRKLETNPNDINDDSLMISGFMTFFFLLNFTETFFMRTSNGFFTSYLFFCFYTLRQVKRGR